MGAETTPISGRAGETLRIPLPAGLAPEQAALWLRGDVRPFALVGEWLGVRAILGSEPLRTAPPDADPFALLDEGVRPRGAAAAVGGGWLGWLGYGLGARIEDLPPGPPASAP